LANKPETRFVVQIGDDLKRLFSVRQGTNGGLLINSHERGANARVRGRVATIREVKYTVHLSENSLTRATTVHSTTVFWSGEEVHLHLLTHAIRDHRYQPIYVAAPRDPRITPTYTPAPRDKVINLGKYDPSQNELLYAVWLTSHQAGPTFPVAPFYSMESAIFGRFSIVVPYCFVPRPSSKLGFSVGYGSSSSEKMTAAAKAVGHRPGVGEGASQTETPRVIARDFQRLIGPRNVNASWQEPAPNPVPAAAITPPLGFLPKPLG
jgi:hypothetical protein